MLESDLIIPNEAVQIRLDSSVFGLDPPSDLPTCFSGVSRGGVVSNLITYGNEWVGALGG